MVEFLSQEALEIIRSSKSREIRKAAFQALKSEEGKATIVDMLPLPLMNLDLRSVCKEGPQTVVKFHPTQLEDALEVLNVLPLLPLAITHFGDVEAWPFPEERRGYDMDGEPVKEVDKSPTPLANKITFGFFPGMKMPGAVFLQGWINLAGIGLCLVEVLLSAGVFKEDSSEPDGIAIADEVKKHWMYFEPSSAMTDPAVLVLCYGYTPANDQGDAHE